LFRESRMPVQSRAASRLVLMHLPRRFPDRGARRARSEPRRFACPPRRRRASKNPGLRAGGAAAPPAISWTCSMDLSFEVDLPVLLGKPIPRLRVTAGGSLLHEAPLAALHR